MRVRDESLGREGGGEGVEIGFVEGDGRGEPGDGEEVH
jgi:hypothetical protein